MSKFVGPDMVFTHSVELMGETRQRHCYIMEVCAPRSKHDTETHRIMLLGGGIVRVSPYQLKPLK